MKITRTFTSGIMNKDLDERLIPQGQYRDGQNIGVSTSEESNVGSIENILGNTQVGGDLSFLTASAATIAAIADSANEEFYWFVTDTNFDYVIRYNETSNSHVVLLKDTKGRVLKFDKEYTVTGINLIDNLLFWTDNLNPPRRLNVDKYYALDSFTEDDISVIVKAPLSPPSIQLQNIIGNTTITTPITPETNPNKLNGLEETYIRFGYRWRYENNEYSALSPFSSTAFGATAMSFNYSDGVFNSMINGFNQVEVTCETGESQVEEIQVVFFNEYTGSVFTVETYNKKENLLADNSTFPVLFNNNKIYSILSADEVSRLFDNVPLKAKAQEIIGGRIIYGNYIQGYDIVDSQGSDIAIDFSVESASKVSTTSVGIPSFKSDRSYEVGLVYLDDYGRMSTVLTPNLNSIQNQFQNTTFIPPSQSSTINDLRISINHRPPEFASKYRIFLKQSRENDYSTVFPLASYRDGNDYYFFINRSEVNKVIVGEFIYMKQLNGLATNSNKQYKVQEVEVKESDFLGNGELPGLYFKITDTQGQINLEEYTAEFNGIGTGSVPGAGTQINSYGGHIIVGLNGNGAGANSYVGQIDFPHYYGNSTTNTKIQLVAGSKLSENETNAKRDARIKIVIGPNDTFDVFNFIDGVYELWYGGVPLSTFYFTTYQIDNPPPATLVNLAIPYDLDIQLRFSDGPGYNQGDYWTINVHSKSGLSVFDVPTINSGNLQSTYFSGNEGTYAGVAPVTAGYQIVSDSGQAFQNNDTNLNPFFPRRDKQINIGATIIIELTEDLFIGTGISETETSESTFFASRNYDNIEEWFYEENIWQTLNHTIAQTGLQNRGKRVFFRRVLVNRGFSGSSTSFSTAAIGVNGTTYYQHQFSQSLGGVPSLNGYPNYPDWPKVLTYTEPIVMYIRASEPEDQVAFNTGNSAGNTQLKMTAINATFKITQNIEGPPVFETKPIENTSDIFYETPFTFNIDKINNLHEANIQNQTLNAAPAVVSLNLNSLPSPTAEQEQNSEFNCFSFGNGIEGTRIKAGDTLPWLKYSPRASTSIEKYEQEHLSASLTYSGVFVENTNVNNLNEFNLSLANYKDVNKEYGPIQKLHTRDNDIITLQEDKISKILFGKNLLSDSVGGGVIASVPQVLGTQVPYVGEYGISHNPESFTSWGSQLYFADAKRGAVIRLGQDGLFEISNNGMSDYFKDLFRDNFTTQKLGVYDPFKEHYVISNTNQNAIPCEASVKTNFIPDSPFIFFTYNSNTSTISIESTRSWSIDLVDTGDGTGWVTINGQTPTYNGSLNETVTLSIANNGFGVPPRECQINITACNGLIFQKTIKQQGSELDVDVWGVLGADNATTEITAGFDYDYTSNTGAPLDFTGQKVVGDSDLFVNRVYKGIEGEPGLPVEGDTVELKISEIGVVNKSTFSPDLGGKMYFLKTNTVYNQSQLDQALADPGLASVTPVLVGSDWVGSFTFNRVGFRYAYFIVDFRNIITASGVAVFDFPAASNNVAGTFKGKIDFTDNEGRVSLPYTPSGVAGNIYTIKSGDTVIATTGTTPVTVAGTLDFVKTSNTNVFDVEIEFFGDNQNFRLEAPLPTLTLFDYESTAESLDPADPLYICRAAAPLPNNQRWHNGSGALPVEGDIVYENPLGTSRTSGGTYHRYGTVAAPNSIYLFVQADGTITQTSACAACAEVAVPVISTPATVYLQESKFTELNIIASNNPTFYELAGTCSSIAVTSGTEGATITWVDCGSLNQNKTLRPNETVFITTAIGYTTTSGTTTSLTNGIQASTYLPEGMEFDLTKGIISGTPSQTGTFPIDFVARNCFGASANFTLTFVVSSEGRRTFLMDGTQFDYNPGLACGLTATSTLFYHSGEQDDPKLNDIVSVPVLGNGGSSDLGPFRGGYVWYFAESIGANGSALLIDDTGTIRDIVTCP